MGKRKNKGATEAPKAAQAPKAETARKAQTATQAAPAERAQPAPKAERHPQGRQGGEVTPTVAVDTGEVIPGTTKRTLGVARTVLDAVRIITRKHGHGEVHGDAPRETGCADCRKAAPVIAVLLGVGLALLGSGCAVLGARTTDTALLGMAWGEKASTALAGVNMVNSTKGTNGVETSASVGIDNASSSGEFDINGIIGKLLVAGLKASPAAPLAPVVQAAQECEDGECENP